jgi:hypothetical protein
MTTPTVKSRDWRAIVFRSVAGLLALLALALQPALPALVEPWVLIAPDGPGYTAAIHRMHEAHWATIWVFVGASALALAWRPRALPTLAQFVVLSILIQATGSFLVGEVDLTAFVVLAIFIAAYPAPRDLVRVSGAGQLSMPLFGLSLLVAALLAPDIGRSLHQFDLDELNIHTPMPASQSAIAQFTPTQPGAYTFYCALHVNLATKQGMAGKLVVTP